MLLVWWTLKSVTSKMGGGNEQQLVGVLGDLMKGIGPGASKKKGTRACRNALGGLGEAMEKQQ